jgi:pyridoxal 5'-phosphate synthase pdxT subunit
MGAGAKEGGQKLLKCLKIHVSRNFFGAQISSFEQLLPAPDDLKRFGDAETYRAVFIRAPAILSADTDAVTVLSEYKLGPEDAQQAGRDTVIVAATSGHMLATAFHPELTEDIRW